MNTLVETRIHCVFCAGVFTASPSHLAGIQGGNIILQRATTPRADVSRQQRRQLTPAASGRQMCAMRAHVLAQCTICWSSFLPLASLSFAHRTVCVHCVNSRWRKAKAKAAKHVSKSGNVASLTAPSLPAPPALLFSPALLALALFVPLSFCHCLRVQRFIAAKMLMTSLQGELPPPLATLSLSSGSSFVLSLSQLSALLSSALQCSSVGPQIVVGVVIVVGR